MVKKNKHGLARQKRMAATLGYKNSTERQRIAECENRNPVVQCVWRLG